MESKALIMMAAYNGGKYISQQIESILGQTYENWILLISDDGSSDDTLRIIERYVKKDPRILPAISHKSEGGASSNFYFLLEKAKQISDGFEYYFFCDQDDIWETEKIEKEIADLRNQNGIAACYSDLTIMTEEGDIVVKMSDIQDIRMNKQEDIFFNQMYIWGNTLAFNGQLLEHMFIPEKNARRISHDHYVGFYGCAFGHVSFIDEPLVRYRRYDANVSELPHKYDLKKVLYRVKDIKTLIKKHAANYAGILYFIRHAPRETLTMMKVKECYEHGGIRSLSIMRKLGVVGGSNMWNSIMKKWILVLRIYQKCDEFRAYE